MKHKLAYGLRQPKIDNETKVIQRRSPKRNHLFESNSLVQDKAFRQTFRYHQERDFNQVKKIEEGSDRMRHTMDENFRQRIGNFNFDEEKEQPDKLNQFLRNTMSHKGRSRRPQNLVEQYPYTKEVYVKQRNVEETTPQDEQMDYDSSTIFRVRSAGNLKHTSANKRPLKAADRVERNKKMVQQLKRSSKRESNYLRNVNHSKLPAYIDLDQPNQTEIVLKRERESREEMEETYSRHLEQCRSLDRKLQTETVISTQPSMNSNKKKRKIAKTNKFQGLIEQFEEGRRLGQGKFGVVNWAKHKPTGAIFALKKIQKSVIRSNMMVDQTALQIRIQSCLSHGNILQMYGFFEDKQHLYIVLEYMDGGTLYQRLKDCLKLQQRQTANIIKQIASAVDYMHDRGIVHRDIKPENVVISNDMYKLCDFGWAAMCDQRRKTYCGTFDYVSPQILSGSEYDMSVDLWCLGVLTYELLTGKAPFYHVSRKQTVKRILNVENHQLEFPSDMSPVARDFIEQLVRKNPQERLKASQVNKHPFIRQIEEDL